MSIDNLSPEQIEKAKECKTAEEFIEFAQSENIELSDDMLNELAGGGFFDSLKNVIQNLFGSDDDE